ncbi:MAG: 3-oxoacid CoA-transferase subunit A [Chloroflexota bacterium]|nr:3-oxoacid CoA-transferase subunit A [Chloroflexota bacterium]
MLQGKLYGSPQAAVADIQDGSTILVAGFAGYGVAERLLSALLEVGSKDLTLIYRDGPYSEIGSGPLPSIENLVSNGQVSKLISPIPYSPGGGGTIEECWQAGQLEIEIVPQGILVERLRAGGAGIGGVFLPTAVGTRFESGRERRTFPQGEAVLELPLKADYALIKVAVADTLGNSIYDGSSRNWAPVMAMAARITVAEAERIVEPGELDPEAIISPGIFVNRIVAAA